MKRRSFFQGLCGLFALPFIKTQPKKLEANPYIHNLPKLGDKPARRLYETLMCTEELTEDCIWGIDEGYSEGDVSSISYTINNMGNCLHTSVHFFVENRIIEATVPEGLHLYMGQHVNAVLLNDKWRITCWEVRS